MKKLALVLVLVACNKGQSEPQPMATSSATTSASPSGASSGDVTWDAPADWTALPNKNAFRKATYKVGDAEATITTAGGNVDQNVKRWAEQFGGATPKIEKKKVNGLDVTVVEIKGTFNGGMMGGQPGPDQMMLGAVVETSPDLTFLKLVGPEKTVSPARASFEKMVSSFRRK